MKKEPMYAIKESELLSFHMAAVLAGGENKLAQDIVDTLWSLWSIEPIEEICD